jgi:hypothetical protein
MQGPICGLLMTEMILDGAATTVDVGELSFDRFAGGRLDGERHVI